MTIDYKLPNKYEKGNSSYLSICRVCLYDLPVKDTQQILKGDQEHQAGNLTANISHKKHWFYIYDYELQITKFWF